MNLRVPQKKERRQGKETSHWFYWTVVYQLDRSLYSWHNLSNCILVLGMNIPPSVLVRITSWCLKDVSHADSLLWKEFPGAGFWFRCRTPAFGQVNGSWQWPQGRPGGILLRKLSNTDKYLLAVSHAFPPEFMYSFLYFCL